jgi:hypothetical protein
MEKQQLVSKDTLAVLEALVNAEVAFMIVGNSAAVLQGAPVVTVDIDLWFGKNQLEKAKAVLKPLGISIVSGFGVSHLPPQFCGPGTEILDIVLTAQGLASFEKELKKSLDIELGDFSVKVLRLDRVIASKKAANREKDRAVISQLESALLTISRKS